MCDSFGPEEISIRRCGRLNCASGALVPLEAEVYHEASRFPETATTSLGVLQPLGLSLIKARSPRNQASVITLPPRSAPLGALLQQVRDQYREMPGLKLTKPQAMRLFGVAPSV